MGYSVKNYTEQGGEKTVIGGILEIAADGALVMGDKAVEVMAHQADSEATSIAGLNVELNALLAKLQAAGYMAGPPE